MFRNCILAALAFVAAPAAAQKPEAPAAPRVAALDPAAERAAIAFAEARGRLLFDLDRAAWVATDDFVARVPDHASQGLRGFIVERDGENFVTTFFGGPEDAPVALYRGTVRDRRVRSREVFPAASRPALTAAQRRLAAAREAASQAVRGRPCGERTFNTAVIPPATPDGPIDVYLMTPQVRQGNYPVGGHFRLTVGADGRAGGERAFTNSCIVLGPGDAPAGERAVAMVVTHLLDPVPTEIHMFTALTSGLPLYVGIGNPPRMFHVSRGGIRLVQQER